MIVFRLAMEQFIHDLSGEGATQAGGRWNSVGTRIIYTSSSRALCTAELAVHLPLGILPTDYAIASIEVPGNAIHELDKKELPSDWNSLPPANTTRKIGDDFIQDGRHLCLRVPSAVVEGDHNYLLNPVHPMMSEIKILSVEPYRFNKRLFLR